MSKIKTPDWVLERGSSNSETRKKKSSKKKLRSFKIRFCPNCGSDNVSVVLGNEEGKDKGEWHCRKCKWKGNNIKEIEINEKDFMDYSNKMKI